MPATLLTSRTNPRVKQLRAAFQANARLAGGLVAIEGENLVYEAVRSGLQLKTIFLSRSGARPSWMPAAAEVVELSDDVFASAVDTRQPQGIAALVAPARWTVGDALGSERSESALILIAAGLQDPGNLGTLIRSAEAFGATGVLTTVGTVSAWNQKALRASAGSVFRLPVAVIETGDVATVKARGIRLLAAVAAGPSGKVNSVAKADLAGPCALMIGNEGAGLTPEWLALADERITIPMPGRVESLNAAVAGSLLLYEAFRQRNASEAEAQG